MFGSKLQDMIPVIEYQGPIMRLSELSRSPAPDAMLEGILGDVKTAMSASMQNFGQIQDQVLGQGDEPVNYLKNLSLNQMGKLQLMQRLEDVYGPGYRTNEDAMGLIRSFDNLLTQQNDINTIGQLLETGKTANDYLTKNEIPAFGSIMSRDV